MAKSGPGLELERARAVGRVAQDAGAGDVRGHQVGRELHAAERQVQRFAEGAHEQGLAQAGDAFQQRVAAREQAGQDTPHDLRLADDHAADLGLDGPRGLDETIRRRGPGVAGGQARSAAVRWRVGRSLLI